VKPSTAFLWTLLWIAGWHFLKSQVNQRTAWLIAGGVLLFYAGLTYYVHAMQRRLRNEYLGMTPEERKGFRQALEAEDPKSGAESYREIAEDRRTDWRWIGRDQVAGIALIFGLPVSAALVTGRDLSAMKNAIPQRDLPWMMLWVAVGGAIYWWLHITRLKRYRCRKCQTVLTRDRSRPGVIFPCERCQCVWHLGDL
jgi:hypothetical protein